MFSDPEMANIRERLALYVPAEDMKIFCSGIFAREEGKTWGYDHVQILAELAGLPEDDPSIHALATSYVLLCNCFFSLDAAVDGHVTDPARLLAVAPLFFVGVQLIEDELAQRVSSEDRRWLTKRITERLLENARAVQVEMERRCTWERPNQDDYLAAVGRSNPTLLYYDILCIINGRFPDEEVIRLLSDLIYYLQMGDDLGDWQHDFQSGNHTMLIRECTDRIEPSRRHDIGMVERELFFGGVYEAYTARIIRNLDRIVDQLRGMDSVQSEKAQAYILKAREKALKLLRDVVSTKIGYIAEHTRREN